MDKRKQLTFLIHLIGDNTMTQAFICDAIRTPFGRYGGALPACAPTTWAPYPSRR